VTRVIPHGIDSRFRASPRVQEPIERYSAARPFRLLYVSIVNVYKHQWHVVEAVARLRAQGLPVVLELVGPAYGPALARLRETMHRLDPSGEAVEYVGPIAYEELHRRYRDADLFVFASSCETFGQIVTEAMSCGLPIACSNRAAMPELLGDAGVYFDPENPHDIACALRELINSPLRRETVAHAAFERARDYSWQKCASDTLQLLADAAIAHRTAHEAPAVI
jgi:glycosyltransferase involved in cell wall biosynthesis